MFDSFFSLSAPLFCPSGSVLASQLILTPSSVLPRSLVAHHPLLAIACLGRIYCICGCPCILREAVSGCQSSSPSAPPAFSLARVSLRRLNCIDSPVANRNLETFAASTGAPKSLVRSVSHLHAPAHISSLNSLNPEQPSQGMKDHLSLVATWAN